MLNGKSFWSGALVFTLMIHENRLWEILVLFFHVPDTCLCINVTDFVIKMIKFPFETLKNPIFVSIYQIGDNVRNTILI